MAKRIPEIIDVDNSFKSFSYQLDADTDYVEVECQRFRNFAIGIQGLTVGDEIKVYGALTKTSTTYYQILDDTDTNPFTADGLHETVIDSFKKIKIVKVGANGTGVTGELSMSN